MLLENPRRQVSLVLLLTLVSLYLIFRQEFNLGPDLSGGTELIYEIDVDAARREGLVSADTPTPELIRQTISIIQDRIDPTGTIEASVTQRGETGILIEIPKMTKVDAEATIRRIETLGSLEMRVVARDDYNKSGVKFELNQEKERLRAWLDKKTPDDKATYRELIAKDPGKVRTFNQLNRDEGGRLSEHLRWYPRLIERSQKNPDAWDYAMSEDPTGHVVAVFAPDQRARPPQGENPFLVELVPINIHERKFTGEDLDPAGVKRGFNEVGQPSVDYVIKGEVMDAYADLSEEYIGKQSAIILNGIVKSAPVYRSRIPGRGQISGGFTTAEADELVKVLKTGSLQVRPDLMAKNTIGPGLGERSIELGMQSMLFGGLAVLAFMIWYYRTSGLVAVICVMLNVLMILGVMQFIRSTFTLPGIAGIVLTIGMAVDGNVLIYERIREELDRGKAVLQAVRAGFDRAMITIFDANLTTLIAGLVLYNVGIGPIRGFAVSLNVGIVTTMFTSFFVCRVVFHYLLQWGLLKEIRMRKWLTHVNVDWMKPAKALVTGSGILILIGLVNFAATPRDVSLGLDFTGGASMQIVLKEPLTRAQLIDRLREDAAFRADFPNAQVTTVGEVKDGKATQFNLKLKLSDQVAERMQQEKAKAKAEGRAFEPPYTRHVLRLLAASLVDQPSSGAELVENPTNPSAKFATLTLHFATPVRVQDLQAKLAVPLPNARVRSADKESPETSKNLTVEFQVEASTTPEQLFPLVKGYLGDLRDTGNQPVELSSPIPEASELGGRLVGELRNAAIGAMVLSLFLVTMYVRVRFHEFKYGIAAVVALLHDVLMSFGVVVAANRLGLVDVELDIGMIAAFLTIVGFSINDTIVIFDRVRENLQDQARLGDTKETFEQLLNRSVNQTMSRTLLTSATVLFVVLAQFLVNYHNQSPLEGFSFTLLIGFLSGVYSTVYIASPVVLWLHNRELRRGGAPGATAGHSPLPTAPATSRA